MWAGSQPHRKPISDHCAVEGEVEGRALDMQDLCPPSLKAMGSDKGITSPQSSVDLSTQVNKYCHFH